MALDLSVFWRGRVGKLLLLLFAVLIILHLVIIGIFAQNSKSAQFRLNYNLMAGQITELIYTFQQASPTELDKTIEKVAIPNISLDLDTQADTKLHISLHDPTWSILRSILQQHPRETIALSVQLSPQKWVNISARVIRTAWMPEFILFLLEALVAVTILVSIWSINRFTGPLKEFRAHAESLGVNLNPKPLAEYGPSVVRDTAHAINQMQRRISDLLRHRMQMLGGLSHDLRTPITRLKLRAQFIDDKELQQKINSDLDQIEEMVSETLAYVREEARSEKKVKLDLVALLSSICADFSDTGANVTFSSNIKSAEFTGSAIALKRAFTNLIDNALKYAGSAEVSIEPYKKHFLTSIKDHGPGIAEIHKPRIFEPYYRAEQSRSRETGGTGLGLAVVKEVIDAHKGTIILEDIKPQGLLVKVVL